MLAFFKKYAIIRELNVREWLSGRALPCQGKGREFESRLPLHNKYASWKRGFFVCFALIKKIFKKNTKFVDNILKICYINSMVPWPRGKARVCKILIPSSNLGGTSIMRMWRNRQTHRT